jgi:folate-dependent phosphoribosylglycinamide formyltransferase PurN
MRIAVICEDDSVWTLATLERTLPLLSERQLRPVGLWVCPAILSRHKGSDIHHWYLNTFGVSDFLKLGLFAVTAYLTRQLGVLTGTRAASFLALAHKHHIHFDRCATPNDQRFVAWLRDEQIDILVILVGYILKDEVLAAPRIGTINKHAAVLPANRGLFPYFWARLRGIPQGISFHEVTRGVDEGRLLIQKRITDIASQRSMVAFYWRVFQHYPEMLVAAIAAMAEGRFLEYPHDVEAGYFGLPTPEDVTSFRKQKGRIVLWRDIIYASKL